MSKATLCAILCTAFLGAAGASEFESHRLGRKLSTLCQMDRCGVWCGPPRGGPCAISRPPCTPPTPIDCHPSQNGGWTNNECNKYCGANPWQQNPSQCGGYKYICHAPPPCNPPTEVWCPWNPSGPQMHECNQFCGPQAMPQIPQPCGGRIFICETRPSDPPSNEPPQQGCVAGNSLPFGLENCICDGAAVGQPAGLAACGRVANECSNNVQPFNVGALEAVTQICDTFALDACLSSSQNAIIENPGCADILRNGTPRCSKERAIDIWMSTVNAACDPLCKNCARLG
jgi:hypothetical protein